jgi:hypothetical protein
MKMSIRTSFSSGRPQTSSGRPRTSAFTRGRGFTRGCGKNCVRTVKIASPRAWTRARGDVARMCGRRSTRAHDRASARTRVDTRRVAMGPRGLVAASAWPWRGGRKIRVLPIKGGALPLFPYFQPSPVE